MQLMRPKRLNITSLSWILLISCLILIQPQIKAAQTAPQAQQQSTDSPQAQTVPELDIELFTKLPYTRQVEISPDGKHIAIIFKRNNEDMLGIIRLSDMKAVQVVRAGGKYSQIDTAIWANNKRVLYDTLSHAAWDKRRFNHGELYAINIDGSKHKAIMGPFVKRQGIRQIGKLGHHQIIDLLPNEEKYILLAYYPWREGIKYYLQNFEAKPIIYKLNINNGRIKPVGKLPTPMADAITDNNHQVRISFGVDTKDQLALHHRKDKDDDWQELKLTGLPAYASVAPIRFSADNNKVYLLVGEIEGPDALYLYDLTKNQATKIYQHDISDIHKMVFNQDGTKIVAVSIEADYPKYLFLDGQDKIAKLHKHLLTKLQGYNMTIASTSHNTERAIIRIYTDYDPGGYYLYEAKSGQLDYILDAKKWIDPNQMASREPIKFKARDGLTIHGYLTRPMGKTQSLPTVILPHGGPHGVQDNWAFDWESQLLANRGYAVLQVNFRGSGGFGYAFEQAGYGQWGAAMQDDLTDATNYLIEQGITDKKRICIYGASYGGYAAIMGTVREPDLYQCAIGSVGVYSLPMMFSEGDIADREQGLSYLKRVLGNDVQKQQRYSPAYNTDKIKAPLLLIHGLKDQRAPIEQLYELQKGLKANNKPHEIMILSDEGHGYLDEKTRVKVYQRIIDFLDKHIGD